MCYSYYSSGIKVSLICGPHNQASVYRNIKSITFSNGMGNERVFQLNFQYSAKQDDLKCKGLLGSCTSSTAFICPIYQASAVITKEQNGKIKKK